MVAVCQSLVCPTLVAVTASPESRWGHLAAQSRSWHRESWTAQNARNWQTLISAEMKKKKPSSCGAISTVGTVSNCRRCFPNACRLWRSAMSSRSLELVTTRAEICRRVPPFHIESGLRCWRSPLRPQPRGIPDKQESADLW